MLFKIKKIYILKMIKNDKKWWISGEKNEKLMINKIINS